MNLEQICVFQKLISFAQYHALLMICAQICHRWHALMIHYITKPGSGLQTKDIGDQCILLAMAITQGPLTLNYEHL